MPEFFGIGTTLETITSLLELDVPIETVKSQHFDYARTVNKGNAGARGVGSPMHLWTVGLATIEMRNQLKGFCPGASAGVFIYTQLNSGVWVTFQCEMLWTEEEEWWLGMKKTFNVKYRALVLVP